CSVASGQRTTPSALLLNVSFPLAQETVTAWFGQGLPFSSRTTALTWAGSLTAFSLSTSVLTAGGGSLTARRTSIPPLASPSLTSHSRTFRVNGPVWLGSKVVAITR